MTGPGGIGGDSIGDAYIRVHGDTSDVEGDIEKGLKKAGKDIEPAADDIGKDVGDRIGKSVEKEIDHHGPGIAKTLGKSIEREVIDVTPNLHYNVRGKDGKFISRTAANIKSEVEDAFDIAGEAGGTLFSKIGQAISDAIGSGFNVSGKSPLVYILAPVYAAIGGLVIAAVQAAQGVIAAILAIPAAISVLLVEVGVLFLAFHGLGEAIQGAFAAKNATELNDAIKNLTPSAQSFVKALLPAKTLFDDLAKSAQANFFAAFGGGARVTALLDAIKKPLAAGIPIVAQSLGFFFAQLAAFFASPLFTSFIDRIFPAVAQIVDMLGGPFINLLVGLFILIVQSLPFLINLAYRFGELLNSLGGLLGQVSPVWLQNMLVTLDKTFSLLGAVIALIAVLFAQVDAGGGNGILDFLTQAVTVLTGFFATNIGKEAIAGIIRLAEIGIFIVVALIEVVALLAAGFQVLTDALAAFIKWLVDTAWPWIKSIFTDSGDTVSNFSNTVRTAIGDALQYMQTFISNGVTAIGDAIRARFGEAVTTVKAFPGQIQAAIGNLGNLLRNAGQSLIQGLIDGINSMIGSLRNSLGFITKLIPDFKGPEDKDRKLLVPAGQAVMEGFNTGLMKGAVDMKNLLGDITSGLGGMNVNQPSTHILFGNGAMQLNFQGALPTANEAMAIGQAVGTGVNSQLAARDTRLAVRTL